MIEDVLEATTTSTKKFGITTKHDAAQQATTQKEGVCVRTHLYQANCRRLWW
jgi:hypothetical protein